MALGLFGFLRFRFCGDFDNWRLYIYLGGFVYLPIIGITSFAAMRIALDIQEMVKKGRHEYGSLKKAYAFCAGSIVIMSLAEIAMFVLMNAP